MVVSHTVCHQYRDTLNTVQRWHHLHHHYNSKLTPPPAPPATTSSASVSPLWQFGVDRKTKQPNAPPPLNASPPPNTPPHPPQQPPRRPPRPPPHPPPSTPPPTHPQRSGGDVLVSPTNRDCDRWLTLTMLQFHPIVLAMTADGILRIVCMGLCREPIRVLTTPPPLSPPDPPPHHTHIHTHTHTLHPTNISKTVLQSCLDMCYMTYICIPFQPYADLFYMHVMHMHTFFSRKQTCSACQTYAYCFSSSPSCSTRHTCACFF